MEFSRADNVNVDKDPSLTSVGGLTDFGKVSYTAYYSTLEL